MSPCRRKPPWGAIRRLAGEGALKKAAGAFGYRRRRKVPRPTTLAWRGKERIVDISRCKSGETGVADSVLGRSPASARPAGPEVASSTNRKFVRMSLGGVRDEGEIAASPYYIGSMPGKITQTRPSAGCAIPVLLDVLEIDQMSTDFDGDPSIAILESVGSEPNSTFNVITSRSISALDGSDVSGTDNSLKITAPTPVDAWNVIRIAGYTEDEKSNIRAPLSAPKQVKQKRLEER